MLSVPKQLATKFVYTQVNPDASVRSIKQALSLLNKARISHCVSSSAANGVPLGADSHDKYFKEIFIDVGLCSSALGLTVHDIQNAEDLQFVNKGGLAEQVVGQLLRTITPYYIQPSLYCWSREEKGSSAEVDYLIQNNHRIVPVEVKAGKTGTLKSLHILMGLKNLSLAIRINADFPSVTEVKFTNSLGVGVKYTLLSLPFYMTGQISRLLEKF
jgi:predicted AAA+ superfamily ATPase